MSEQVACAFTECQDPATVEISDGIGQYCEFHRPDKLAIKVMEQLFSSFGGVPMVDQHGMPFKRFWNEPQDLIADLFHYLGQTWDADDFYSVVDCAYDHYVAEREMRRIQDA